MNSKQTQLFNQILNSVRYEFKNYNIKNLKTKKGNTQLMERTYIEIIRDILHNNNLIFEEAGSQQPYDFRIKMDDNTTMLLEAKKTDTQIVYFNDTCPCINAYYIIIYTGKTYKTNPKNNILPCIFGVNGYELIKDDLDWLNDYKKEISILKEKYKNCGKNMFVFPRPTYKANIRFLFDKYYDEAKIEFLENVYKYEDNDDNDDIDIDDLEKIDKKIYTI